MKWFVSVMKGDAGSPMVRQGHGIDLQDIKNHISRHNIIGPSTTRNGDSNVKNMTKNYCCFT